MKFEYNFDNILTLNEKLLQQYREDRRALAFVSRRSLATGYYIRSIVFHVAYKEVQNLFMGFD